MIITNLTGNAGAGAGAILAVGAVQPLENAEHAVAGDERRRPLGEQAIHIGDLEAGELEHVAEVLGREEGELQPLPLDHRVDADGGAMGEVGDLARADAVALAEALDALHDLAARRIGAREHLQALDLARLLIEHGEVRERAADVDADPVTHVSVL